MKVMTRSHSVTGHDVNIEYIEPTHALTRLCLEVGAYLYEDDIEVWDGHLLDLVLNSLQSQAVVGALCEEVAAFLKGDK